MRSNPLLWVMLSQRRNDDSPALRWRHSLRGANGGDRHIIGFNTFLNRSILGFTDDLEMRNLGFRVDIQIFSGFGSDKDLLHHHILQMIMTVGNRAGNI